MWNIFISFYILQCAEFLLHPARNEKRQKEDTKKGKRGLKNVFTLNVSPPTSPQLWRLIRFGGLQAILVLVGPQSVSYRSVSEVKQQMDTRGVTRGLFHQVMWGGKKTQACPLVTTDSRISNFLVLKINFSLSVCWQNRVTCSKLSPMF